MEKGEKGEKGWTSHIVHNLKQNNLVSEGSSLYSALSFSRVATHKEEHVRQRTKIVVKSEVNHLCHYTTLATCDAPSDIVVRRPDSKPWRARSSSSL